MQDFKKLKVWEKAHQLALRVYAATRGFPADEVFGLRTQMRRASSSIGLNIAEGCGRTSQGELRRFLRLAQGSASELEYSVLLARELDLLSEQTSRDLSDRVVEIKRMTTALIRKLKTEKLRTEN